MREILPGIFTATGEFTRPVGFSVNIKRLDFGSHRRLDLELVNESLTLNPAFVVPLVLEVPVSGSLKDYRFLVNGFTSFSGSGSRSLAGREPTTLIRNLRQVHTNYYLRRRRAKGDFISHRVSQLSNPRINLNITIGFLELGETFTQIRTHVHGGKIFIYAQLQWEGRPLAPGTRLKLPSVFLSASSRADILSVYAGSFHRANKIKKTRAPNGYCTWYHYFTEIDEKKSLENLEALPGLPGNIRLFQLDDGYQNHLGDWLSFNHKFPNGIDRLASAARSKKIQLGVWTAPFMARPESRLARENPDWVLRDPRGNPIRAMWNPNWGWRGYAWSLDPTHPGLLDYLREVYSYFHARGVRFFKLDFLFAATLPGVYLRADGRTSFQVLRDGLEVIRQATGRSTLLGCGIPLEAGFGLVDSARVSNDVTPYWSNYIDRIIGRGFEQLSTRNVFRNVLARSFMQNTMLTGDPDCFLSRDENNKLTAAEKISLGSLIALSGGPVMISDEIAGLTPQNRDLIAGVLALQKEVRAISREYQTPDLMHTDFPELQLAQGRQNCFLGVYNMGERATTRQIKLARLIPYRRFQIQDYWSGQPLRGDQQGNLRLKLGAHACAVLKITPTAE